MTRVLHWMHSSGRIEIRFGGTPPIERLALVRWRPDEQGQWSARRAGTETWFTERAFRIDLE